MRHDSRMRYIEIWVKIFSTIVTELQDETNISSPLGYRRLYLPQTRLANRCRSELQATVQQNQSYVIEVHSTEVEGSCERQRRDVVNLLPLP